MPLDNMITEVIAAPFGLGIEHSGRARGRFEPSSSKLHRAKCGDGKQVADNVGSLDASKRGGRKSRLEQIAHLLWGVAVTPPESNCLIASIVAKRCAVVSFIASRFL